MPKGDAVQLDALERLVPEENRRFAAGVLASRCGGFTPEEIQRFPEHAQLAILFEVALERTAQDAKWGQQDHPLVDSLLAEQAKAAPLRTVARMSDEYEIPTASRAKFLTDVAARRGNVTFGHIATEEQSEFIEQATLGDLAAARQEAIQAAAVWVAIVERIDRMTAERLANWQADPEVQAVARRLHGAAFPHSGNSSVSSSDGAEDPEQVRRSAD